MGGVGGGGLNISCANKLWRHIARLSIYHTCITLDEHEFPSLYLLVSVILITYWHIFSLKHEHTFKQCTWGGLGNATPGNVWVFLKLFEFLSLWKGISCSLRAVFSHSRFCRFSHFRFSRYAVNPTIHTGKYNSSIRIVRLSQEDNYDIIDEWFST